MLTNLVLTGLREHRRPAVLTGSAFVKGERYGGRGDSVPLRFTPAPPTVRLVRFAYSAGEEDEKLKYILSK